MGTLLGSAHPHKPSGTRNPSLPVAFFKGGGHLLHGADEGVHIHHEDPFAFKDLSADARLICEWKKRLSGENACDKISLLFFSLEKNLR